MLVLLLMCPVTVLCEMVNVPFTRCMTDTKTAVKSILYMSGIVAFISVIIQLCSLPNVVGETRLATSEAFVECLKL